jgi:hypothetical protein
MEFIKKIFIGPHIDDYEDLKEMIYHTQILLDLNILDFSSKINIIILVLRELCFYLNINEDKAMQQVLLNQLHIILKEKLDIFDKDTSFANYNTLQSYSLFLMILLINLKTKKNLIYSFFEKDSKMVKILINLIKISKTFQNANKIEKIFCNLFLDEYKELFFIHNDTEFEELFILNNEKFSKVNTEGVDIFPKYFYTQILNKITRLDFNYELLFKGLNKINLEKNKNIIEDNDKSIYKLNFVHSLIRIAFSNEKASYIKDNTYELSFIKFVISKCISETKLKYGDNYTCLFRKDEIYEDIIKYFFFIFGNSLLIKSFITPLKSVLYYDQIDEVNKEDFLVFFDTVIKNISSFMPNILKVILKLVYGEVNRIFTIEKNKFAPMFTLLFFNFFTSPKIQEIHNVSPSKFPSMRSLNRIIRNICYNTKFDEKDELAEEFNDIIVKCNSDVREIMENVLASVNEGDESMINAVKENTQDKYLVYPKFLFYFDCSFISYTFKAVYRDNYNLQESK